MTEQELSEIEARAAAATPGPVRALGAGRLGVWPPEDELLTWVADVDGLCRDFPTEVEALRWALARLLRRADRLAAVANAGRDAHAQLGRALLALDRRE